MPGRHTSDHVFLASEDVDQVPEDVEERLVRLLDAMDAEARHGEAEVADLGHPAAVAAGESDGQQARLARRLEGAVDVGRLAARRDPQGDVAGPAEHPELLREG